VSLVLSLFPGIGLLDRAFEEEGFCVVRGPDLLWGGDIKTFHPPAGVFDGVIGGPPCQAFSSLKQLYPAAGKEHGNLIPEFERVVREARPAWFLMENVTRAPDPDVLGYGFTTYDVQDYLVGGFTLRRRKWWFGTPGGKGGLEIPPVKDPVSNPHQTVLASAGGPWKRLGGGTVVKPPLRRCLELQGLPPDFFGDDSPFLESAKYGMIGNGVPLPMGRAIAKAVRRALEEQA